ncbi:hypothetical protein CBD41_01655 [bacterium TMED181]|nr:hypothetical protein [Planctomycetota bacterium]OUW47088.1 MAG: hypothetical protein CBD41_01655 [bacterium TMED181]
MDFGSDSPTLPSPKHSTHPSQNNSAITFVSPRRGIGNNQPPGDLVIIILCPGDLQAARKAFEEIPGGESVRPRKFTISLNQAR